MDATGCNIGVYYDNAIAGGVATLNKADIHGSNSYILGNNILQGGAYGPRCVSNIDTSGSINPQVFLNTPATCTASVGAASASARRIKVVPEKP